MKVSGFTFCRNAVRYDYPLVESIRSIGDPKIRMIESVWDETLRKDGLIYAQQTNIALAQCTGDWAFYLQADEVIHEDDVPRIVEAMRTYHRRSEVKGLVFRYLHFVGDYWSVNPWFYHKAVRIIRNN